MPIVRLLGGSHHGKKMNYAGRDAVIYMTKKAKKKRWSPSDLLNDDPYFTIEHEQYELQTMRKVTAVDDFRYYAEYKKAYIKKGAKIKPETFWKLAFAYESGKEWY
jgi:hypothetical protein